MFDYKYDYTIGSTVDDEQEKQKNRTFLRFLVGFAVLIFLVGLGVFVYKKLDKK